MKNLLASASVLVLSSTAVLAADLPMSYKSPAPVMAPVFSWTGCYVGVHAGGGAMRDSWTGVNGTGGLAGGQVGCNYQDGNWVFGGEAEGYWSGLKGTRSGSEGFGSTEGFTESTKNKYDYSIAARAGIAFDRTLVYGKAGWVWGQFDVFDSSTFSNPIQTETGSVTLNGLLLGVGIEHALTQNWTVKLEYNYLKYGNGALNIYECQFTCGTFGTGLSAEKQIFKIGVNYLFPVGGPVVAKY
jgi:outer membrane immunogenic protein